MNTIKTWLLYLWHLCTSAFANLLPKSVKGGEEEVVGRSWWQFIVDLVKAGASTTGKLLRSPVMVKLAVLCMLTGWSIGVYVVAHRMGHRAVPALKGTIEMQAESIVDLNKTVQALKANIEDLKKNPPTAAAAPPKPEKPVASPKKKTEAPVKRRPPAKTTALAFPF